MTRKRFIKLLMSHGETPRSARAIAFLYNANETPYKKAYSDYRLKTSVRRAFAAFGKAALKCGESISKVAQSLKKLTEAIR